MWSQDAKSSSGQGGSRSTYSPDAVTKASAGNYRGLDMRNTPCLFTMRLDLLWSCEDTSKSSGVARDALVTKAAWR